MGRRDQPELTPSEPDLAEAEAATRRLLTAYGEPAALEPPPGLAARVVAALPASPAAGRGRRPWWAELRPALAYAAVLLLALVGMGALAASTGLGRVAVAPESALGRISLALAGSPLGDLLAGGGAALGVLALAAGAWLWWRLARRR